MKFKSFTVQSSLRLGLICAVMFVTSWLIISGRPLTIIAGTGALLAAQIYSFFRYISKSNRHVVRFFNALRHEDFSESFSDGFMGGSFQAVSTELNTVMQKIREARSSAEAQFLYLESVFQHVPAGMISIRHNGNIELINTAAKNLLGINSVHNVSAIISSHPEFGAFYNNIHNTGTCVLHNTRNNGDTVTMSVTGSKFSRKGELYTLVTLQDISSQLEHETIKQELHIAQNVQTRLFPEQSPGIPGIDIQCFCKPAEEVGGDYYDFIHISDTCIGIVLGDVSGKGIPAAFYTTLIKGSIQSLAYTNSSAKTALSRLNQFLYDSMERQYFCTMFYAVLDFSAMTLHAFRAGHTPAFVFKNRDQSWSWLKPQGIALGLQPSAAFENMLQPETVHLESGDQIVLFTDGFTEAMNSDFQQYGEDRLGLCLKNNADKQPGELIESVRRHVAGFTGNHPQSDDMTMVALKIK